MNFFNPLLQGLQFMRFNFHTENKQVTHSLFKEHDIKQEEPDAPLPSLNNEYLLKVMTQQELIKRQFELVIDIIHIQQSSALKPEPEPSRPATKKISKKTNTCGHPDKEHYAKGMCNNCYHRFGRNKQPWLCSHKKLYACGLCQNCYINQYNRKRRTEGQPEPPAESQEIPHE